jgi:IMP dehydrogenase
VNIRECMKQKVIFIRDKATVSEAAALFRQHHIGTLPVVDDEDHLIGIIRLHGLLGLVLPDFVSLVNHFEYVHDFGALEDRQPDQHQLEQCVVDIMDKPVSVHANNGLVMAAALLQDHHIYDLPVVDQDNRIVGIASHVDIGVALMSNWNLP